MLKRPRARRAAALFGAALLASSLLLMPDLAGAKDASWHEYSNRYEVYLGLYPAAAVLDEPLEAAIHGIALEGLDPNTLHVMVAIYHKSDRQRVTDAAVVAKVAQKRALRDIVSEKRLDRMDRGGSVTYCQFFELSKKTLADRGDLVIDISISEPGLRGESVRFFQKAGF